MRDFSTGLSWRTVRQPGDFLLAEYDRGEWRGRFAPGGRLALPREQFFPELYCEAELELGAAFPDADLELLRGESAGHGWVLLFDRHGYLVLRREAGEALAVSRLPLGTYAEPRCRVGFAIANIAWPVRDRAWAHEHFEYSRVQLLAGAGVGSRLEAVDERPLEDAGFAPVPECWRVPPGSPLTGFRAYNTVRRELWSLPDHSGGPEVKTDFDGASRVFGRFDRVAGEFHLLSGPEVLRSTSYWLHARVVGAVPGVTRLRMHLSFGSGMPNMAPVFFWSTDRENWRKVRLLEATDPEGRFRPLLEAPAGEFYLATSIPFQARERARLFEFARALPGVTVETIGLSPGGEPIELATVTDVSVPDSAKFRCFLIVGQHSPEEMIGAHLFRPLLAELAKTPELLRRIILHFVPTVNVDSARVGSDGVNLDGWNTNRCWSEHIQPEVAAIQTWCLTGAKRFDLFIDIHAGGTWRNHNLLYFSDESIREHAVSGAATAIARRDRLFELLARHCGIRKCDGFAFPFRGCGAKDWFLTRFPGCAALDLEMSTCSNFDPRIGHTVPVSQDSLAMIGRGFAAVLGGFTD